MMRSKVGNFDWVAIWAPTKREYSVGVARKSALTPMNAATAPIARENAPATSPKRSRDRGDDPTKTAHERPTPAAGRATPTRKPRAMRLHTSPAPPTPHAG